MLRLPLKQSDLLVVHVPPADGPSIKCCFPVKKKMQSKYKSQDIHESFRCSAVNFNLDLVYVVGITEPFFVKISRTAARCCSSARLPHSVQRCVEKHFFICRDWDETRASPAPNTGTFGINPYAWARRLTAPSRCLTRRTVSGDGSAPVSQIDTPNKYADEREMNTRAGGVRMRSIDKV